MNPTDQLSAEYLWDDKYVDGRLGREASWPQIIEAANYTIKSAIEKAYKQGFHDRGKAITLRPKDRRDHRADQITAEACEPWTVHPNGKNSHSIDYIDPEFKNVTELVAAHNTILQLKEKE